MSTVFHVTVIHRSGVRWCAAVLTVALGFGSVLGQEAPAADGGAASLAPWSPGTLDIHHINTGQGNATFFVLPDGTTRRVRVASDRGHVVVRVEPGGRRYHVLVLDEADDSVRSRHGPYDSR